MFFLLLVVVMFTLILWGIIALKGNMYFSSESITRTFNYYKYRVELSRDGTVGILAGIQGIAKKPAVYQSSTSTARTASSIPVLVYHGVLEKPDGSNINMVTERFKEQLFALKKAGYNTIDSQQLYKYLKGEISLPENSFMVTFDDGREDVYRNADPVLRALGFKASMFVITKYSLDAHSNYYLSEYTIKNMSKSGTWDIEAHTQDGHSAFGISPVDMGHFFADRLWLADSNRLETKEEFEQRVAKDFVTVKEKLEKVTGNEPISFAFPFGDFGQNDSNFPEAKNLVLETGSKYFKLLFYQNAPGKRFTSNYFLPESSNYNTYLIKRIDANPEWSGEDILQVINNTKSKSLPYTDDFSVNRGWLASWGEVVVDPKLKNMSIKPGPAQTGGSAILDGSRLWQNYKVTTLVNVPNQNSVYVWVRFKDDQNNVACNFGQGFAHVEQTIDGVQKVIKGENNANLFLPTGDFRVGINVNGRQVDCLINGEVVVSTPFVDPSLVSGGVGFKTWDTAANRSLLIVKKIEVQKI